jgi:hypothetical protein
METFKSGQGKIGEQPRIRGALALVLAELEALPDSELVRINLEPLASVSTVRGALPRILPLREQIRAALPLFNLSQLDKLETYALALMAAHSLYCAAKGLRKDRSRLAAETYQLRQQLLTDVNFLRHRGLLVRANALELRGPIGHLNNASDVMTLATLLRENWAQLSRYCAATLADLDRAEVLSDSLTFAVGDREPVPAVVVEATLRRQRAYTLLIRAYTEVREAVGYVRQKAGDADIIAPSLYCRRKRSAKAIVQASVEDNGGAPEAEAAAQPSPSEPTTATRSEDPFGSDPFLH